MLWLAIVSMLLLFVVWGVHGAVACRYVRQRTRQLHVQELEPANWPRLAVFMPVRGVDPFLKDSIRSILNQDYPDFELRIILDHATDAGAADVAAVLQEMGSSRVRVDVLRNRLPTCSLVCSALVQFVEDVEDHCDAVTFCATDQVLPPGWLRRIARPLSDPRIVTPLGNRWYEPAKPTLGSLTRYVWNLGAVLQMWSWQVPWGGALCLRIRDIQTHGLVDLWRSSMVEDVVLIKAFANSGRQFAFDPWLMAINRESATLTQCFRFMCRQVLWAKMYHPKWRAMLAYAWITCLAVMVSIVSSMVAAFRGDWFISLLLNGALVVFVISNCVWAWLLELSLRDLMRVRGEPVLDWTLSAWCKLPLAAVLAQFIHFAAMVRAGGTRSISWRGQSYVLQSDGSVRMSEETPWTASQQPGLIGGSVEP